MASLHLIDADSPQAQAPTLALLAQTARAEPGARVLLLGGGRLGAAARAAGLTEDDRVRRIGVPFGRAERGLLALRRAIKAAGEPGLIHAWSAGAWRAAAWLRPGTPRIGHLVQPAEAPWRRALRGRDSAPTALTALDASFAPSRTDVDVSDRLYVPGAPVGAPLATDDAETQRAARQAWRAHWRCPCEARDEQEARAEREAQARHADEQKTAEREAGEFVIALIGDPVGAADCHAAALTAGLVRETLHVYMHEPPSVALLVHPTQVRRRAAARMMACTGTAMRLIQAPALAAPWRVLAGCDAALVAHDAQAGGLSVATAQAMGLPIVGPRRGILGRRVAHESTGLLAVSEAPKHLAAALQRLLIEPGLADKLGAAGRAADHGLMPWRRAVAQAERHVAAVETRRRNGVSTASPVGSGVGE